MGIFNKKSEGGGSSQGQRQQNSDERNCPKCGEGLEADVKFCPHCGAKAAEFTCNKCGAAIPPDAKFCPVCGNDVRKSLLGKLVGANEEEFARNREWKRNPGDFARKFEVEDLRGMLKKSVTVAEVLVLLIQGGAYVGDLRPGHYSLGNILEAKLPLNLDDRSTVVVIDDGIIAIDFSLNRSQVRTKDSIPVGISGRLTLRNTDSKKFIDNLLKGKSQIVLSDLEADLTYDIQGVVQATVRNYTIDELYGNLSVKQEIEEQVRTHVAPTLNSYGFSIEQLRFVRCDETDWQEIIEKRTTQTKKVTGKELDLDTEQQIRALLANDRINNLTTEDKVDVYVHDLAKVGIIRTDEIQNLKIELNNNRDDKDFIRSTVREKAQLMHRHDMADADMDHSLGQDNRKQAHQITTDDARREHEDKWAGRENAREVSEMENLLNVKKQMDAAKLQRQAGEQDLQHKNQDKEAELEGVKLKNRTDASVEALLTMTEGKTAEHLTELEKMKRAANLDADQIVALNATDPIAAAEAMKQKFGSAEMEKMHAARLGDQQAFMGMMEKNFGENSDRMVNVMNQALNAMGSTATARSSAQQAQGSTVVTGGGFGQPVIVNPVQPENKRACPNCGAENSTSTAFCKECGTKF